MSKREYEVWICPECGEQITDEPTQNPRTYKYSRGHYHDPPKDWPGGEDPWFAAVSIRATDNRDLGEPPKPPEASATAIAQIAELDDE